MSIEVNLDIKPLSVNRAWQGRKYKTKEYNAWRREIEILMPRKEMIQGDVSVTVIYSLVRHRRTDLDNLFKTLFDSIVNRGYIEDDTRIVEIHAKKVKSKVNTIYFSIEPYDQSAT